MFSSLEFPSNLNENFRSHAKDWFYIKQPSKPWGPGAYYVLSLTLVIFATTAKDEDDTVTIKDPVYEFITVS